VVDYFRGAVLGVDYLCGRVLYVEVIRVSGGQDINESYNAEAYDLHRVTYWDFVWWETILTELGGES